MLIWHPLNIPWWPYKVIRTVGKNDFFHFKWLLSKIRRSMKIEKSVSDTLLQKFKNGLNGFILTVVNNLIYVHPKGDGGIFFSLNFGSDDWRSKLKVYRNPLRMHVSQVKYLGMSLAPPETIRSSRTVIRRKNRKTLLSYLSPPPISGMSIHLQ